MEKILGLGPAFFSNVITLVLFQCLSSHQHGSLIYNLHKTLCCAKVLSLFFLSVCLSVMQLSIFSLSSFLPSVFLFSLFVFFFFRSCCRLFTIFLSFIAPPKLPSVFFLLSILPLVICHMSLNVVCKVSLFDANFFE